MGYLSQQLEELLTNNNKSWSPNMVRMIIISDDYIIIENHIGGTTANTKKLVLHRLDTGSLVKDTLDMSRLGYTTLFSALSKKSLSCLEELYFDAEFFGNNVFLNELNTFVDSISNSRLRYYGFLRLTPDAEKSMIDAIYNNKFNREATYSLYDSIEDKSWIKSINSDCWHKRYFLRPNWYSLDEKGGKLDTHFQKIEEQVELLNKVGNIKDEKRELALLLKSVGYSKYEKAISRLCQIYAHKDEDMHSVVVRSFNEAGDAYKQSSYFIKGLNKYWMKGAFDLTDSNADFLVRIGLIEDCENSKLTKEALLNHKDLFNLDIYLNLFTASLSRAIQQEGKYVLLEKIARNNSKEVLPQCKIMPEGKGSGLDGYFKYVSLIIGKSF